MNKIEKITRLIKADFPDCNVSSVEIIERSSDMGIKCKINNELFYISSLPETSRKSIYSLIN